MTNKIEIEFGETNYEGSKVFSSLADVLGLSVDLVSLDIHVDWPKRLRRRRQCLATPPPEKSHIAIVNGERRKSVDTDVFKQDGKSPTWKNKQIM
jgi:hypothetical protein